MKSLKLSVIAALMFTLGACKSAEEYVEIPAEVMDDKNDWRDVWPPYGICIQQ